MNKVFIRTHAYNAKNTLRRAVDSVLNQTYTNFCYYLCDNGSTDGGATRRIVEQYAKNDSRVVPYYNELNHVWEGNETYRYLPHNIEDNDYYCELDADDEYKVTFLEEMLNFMNKYNLDIACCGSDFLSVEQRNKLVGHRLLNDNLLFERRHFADYFPMYHAHFRPVWGKLYKGYTLRNTILNSDEYPNYPKAYGGDTFFTFRALRDSNRVGILAKPLHKYYMSQKSVSYKIHPQRVKCDQILFEDEVDFLEKYGPISQRNWDFLYAVYMNALKDTFNVLKNAQISIEDKLTGLNEMFTYKQTRLLAARDGFGSFIGNGTALQKQRGEFFSSIANWLLALNEIPQEQAKMFCDIGEFACAAAENAEGWLFFQKLRISLLIDENCIDEAIMMLEDLKKILPKDEGLAKLQDKLNNVSSTRVKK